MDEMISRIELEEWRASVSGLIRRVGPQAADELLRRILSLSKDGGRLSAPRYPGDLALEERATNVVRWNAAAMVLRANRKIDGIGGHLSTYASAADLFEVGFNHFFRGQDSGENHKADFVYFQGHASPGVYARSFLEGRLSERQLDSFRQEAFADDALSSYPHPWLMPDYWQFPTVSMGLSPIMGIYLARFLRYAEQRGLTGEEGRRVWVFLGDGEMDEPESRGALSIAAREGLSNLVFVVNCNLQRLDGPVRGNGSIVRELEQEFRGAGWRVVPLIWGSEWEDLLGNDRSGLLRKRLGELSDGDLQKIAAEDGSSLRKEIFAEEPLAGLVADHSDQDLKNMRWGGHDPEKIFSAYHQALHPGDDAEARPVVVLARTIKGFKLGEGIEARNITHQVKSLEEKQLRELRDRLQIPLSDRELRDIPYWHPGKKSEISAYVQECRRRLGGYLPERKYLRIHPVTPGLDDFSQVTGGSGDKEVSTTMAFGRILQTLLKDKRLGNLIVPIIPDEARTFGLEPLFGRYKIYSPQGQTYEPVDAGNLIEYRESEQGQVLEEGITEAGAMSSFIAAGTAYANLNLPTIPFYIFYSMFGFQRVGDLIWAAMDARSRGFLIGATAGKTSLSGEGLQHQDGSSPLVAAGCPAVKCFDPAYGYELAVIIAKGLEEMCARDLSVIYYITAYNDNYPMPAMPENKDVDDILRGVHLVGAAREDNGPESFARILASGPLVAEAFAARDLLRDEFALDAEIWSVTSWSELAREAEDCERFNAADVTREPRQSVLQTVFGESSGPLIGVSDYVKAVACQIAEWMPAHYRALGTDGFGRSDGTPALREFFGISAGDIAYETARQSVRSGRVDADRVHAFGERLQLRKKYQMKRGMGGVEYARGH